jgi:hypothetical protein
MPWLVDGVFIQGNTEAMSDLPSIEPRPPPARIVHFVNPFRSVGGDCDDRTQALTFETMRRARAFASDIPIELAAVVAQAELECVPEAFDLAGTLNRSADQIQQFEHPAPLPLLFEILSHGAHYARGSAERYGDAPEDVFLVYTNADICLMPHFYATVVELIAHGFEAMTINRRTIPQYERNLGNIGKMYAEFGNPHPGYDCFVFPLAHFDRYVSSDACIGRDFVARSLLYNMIANAKYMVMLRHAHLTFHIGNEQEWNDPKLKDYREFNVKQAIRVLVTLAERDPATESKLVRFCQHHREPFKFTAKQ